MIILLKVIDFVCIFFLIGAIFISMGVSDTNIWNVLWYVSYIASIVMLMYGVVSTQVEQGGSNE